MTPATRSSGLVPNPPSSAPYVPPTRSQWDLVFQPLFDEYYNPPSAGPSAPADEILVPAVDAQQNDGSAGLSSSTTIDQDAPPNSTSQTDSPPQT